MQGSLNEPPIIVRESWLSWGGTLLAGAAVFAAALYLTLTDEGGSPAAAWFGVAASAAFCGGRYLLPARIEIWPDHFAWRGVIPVWHRYAFADIEEFSVQYMEKGGVVVGFRFAIDSPRRTKLAAVVEVLVGNDDAIGGSWELSPDALTDLLNRTRLLPSAWK